VNPEPPFPVSIEQERKDLLASGVAIADVVGGVLATRPNL
jgi:hypothetical protein